MPALAQRQNGRWLLLAAVVIALMLPAMGAASNTERFENLGHKMMCTCGCGQILLECNHVGCPNSDGMRQNLATLVAQTGDDQQIIQDFIQQYGPTVMAAPVFRGFNILAWVMPFAVLVLLVVGGVFFLKTWSARRSHAVSGAGEFSAPGASSDVLRRIREETEL